MNNMLSLIMKECRNYFVSSVQRGRFVIEEGTLAVPKAFTPGQYIRIKGSIKNDGIYQAEEDGVTITGLQDEIFSGAVCGLAVPQEFLALAEEIAVFQDKAGKDKNRGMVVSESFKGYSYTAATNAGGAPVSWPEVFAARLNNYRKMFEERI